MFTYLHVLDPEIPIDYYDTYDTASWGWIPSKEYHRFNGITTWDHDQIRCKSTNLSKVSPYLFAGTEVQSGAP